MARIIKRIAPSESSFIVAGTRYWQSVILVSNELFVSYKGVLHVKALRNQTGAMESFSGLYFSVNSGLIYHL